MNDTLIKLIPFLITERWDLLFDKANPYNNTAN